MAKQEIKTVVEAFAAAAVEHARIEAINMVEEVINVAGAAAMERMMANMSPTEILALGRSLSDEWEAHNDDNAAAVAAQKATLAKVMTVLINAGAASMMVEMN